MCSRCTSICDQFSAAPPICLANLITSSVHVAEKKSTWTSRLSFCLIRFDWSPCERRWWRVGEVRRIARQKCAKLRGARPTWPPMASISSASSRTKTRILLVSMTRIWINVHTLPAVPQMICCSILKPFSYRSSRRMHLTATEPLSIRYLPILRISSSICFASSRVGVRQSACGTFSSDATLSIPRTKHAVFPVPLCDCASRLRPAQIFGSAAAWIFDGRTNFISYSAFSRFSGSASFGSLNEVTVTECSASFELLLSSTRSVSASRSPILFSSAASTSTSSAGAASAEVIASTPAPLAASSAGAIAPLASAIVCARQAARRARARSVPGRPLEQVCQHLGSPPADGGGGASARPIDRKARSPCRQVKSSNKLKQAQT